MEHHPPPSIPNIQLNFKTHRQIITVGDKSYHLELIENLDHAIDQLCEALGDTMAKHPRAEDLCPYFGLLWPSGLALAEKIQQSNSEFFQKKVIELGCGLALPTMVAQRAGAKVLSTDIHPDVPRFLERNALLNGMQIPYQFLDWATANIDQSLNRQFDYVIGADVLYESKHPKDLAQSMLQFLAPDGEIWLTDPGRTYLQDFVGHARKLGLEEEFEVHENGEGKEIFLLKLRPKDSLKKSVKKL